MNTFFEKLTGSGTPKQKPMSHNPVNFPPAQKEEIREAFQAPAARERDRDIEEQKPHQLKVESDDHEVSSPAVEEEQDEGELTVDIYDRGDSIVVQSTVAGVRPEDLDVSLTNDTITIRGKRERQELIQEKDYYYKELFWGSFSRSIILPEEIEDDMAEASFRHGLLTVMLPKRKKGVVQKLKVRVT